jgi:hypothetical protein
VTTGGGAVGVQVGCAGVTFGVGVSVNVAKSSNAQPNPAARTITTANKIHNVRVFVLIFMLSLIIPIVPHFITLSLRPRALPVWASIPKDANLNTKAPTGPPAEAFDVRRCTNQRLNALIVPLAR